MASDEDLVGDVAGGSEPALEELLGRYERPLKTFLLRNGAGEDVDDLFQEVWIRVVRGAPGFDRSRRFSSWMFAIAVNCCRDQFARRRRYERDAKSDAESSHPGPDADRVDAERLLEGLAPQEREVLVLRYYNDLSEARMSEVLEIPRGTVKSRLHAAVRKLAEFVGRPGTRRR